MAMRASFGLLAVCLVACKAGYASGLPTRELLRQPALAAQADALGDDERVDSERIGGAGAPSCSYARFAALVAKLTPAEQVALLRHRSPIVRAYVARHLTQSDGEICSLSPEVVAGLRPVLRDDTVISILDGCIGEETALGEHVARGAETLRAKGQAVTHAARRAGSERSSACAGGPGVPGCVPPGVVLIGVPPRSRP